MFSGAVSYLISIFNVLSPFLEKKKNENEESLNLYNLLQSNPTTLVSINYFSYFKKNWPALSVKV